MQLIPEKTVERLSLYRRLLISHLNRGETSIFSHELAVLANCTPAQVRRDIMNIGYSGSPRKGYHIKELINCIGKILDPDMVQNIALIGAGNLGKAILSYFKGKRPKLSIVAAFDKDPAKTGRVISGVRCFHIKEIPDIIKEKNITMGIITATGESAPEVAEILIDSGIKAILNFTPTPLRVPPNVFLEEMDITVSLEKVAYFAKNNNKVKKFRT